jgi:transcription elongation factor GreA
MIEGKIKELEDALANCEIVDEIKANGAVVLGSEILVDIDGRQETFIVVGSAEADPINRKISEESPVGRALIGAKKGDTIEVKLPNATMVCKIVEIK